MVSGPGVPVRHLPRGDIDLAPDDRLDPEFLGHLVKGQGPEQIAVIRDGGRGKPEINGLGTQILDPDTAVEQGIFSVAMKMGEI
jgi:hypothetical protein